MPRATGAYATLLLKRKADYDTRATGNFWKMPFTKCGLGAEQGLINDPVLGFGRQPQDPSYDIMSNDGDIVVPVDARYMGLWLTGLLGSPVSAANKANGKITFAANPANGSTITLNGIVWTFVSAAPSGNQIQIGANLNATLGNAVTALNASANAAITPATYSNPSGTYLYIEYDTTGAGGNAYTLAASAATVSDATLNEGGYKHRFVGGADTLPFYDIEQGNPQIPAYAFHEAVAFNSMSLNFERTGVAQATIGCIGRVETPYTTSQGGTPASLTFQRISQFQGSILSAGVPVANLQKGSLSYSNNFDKVNEIRSDDKLAGVDPGMPQISGSLEARYGSTGLVTPAFAKTPVDLLFKYKLTAGLILAITVPQARLKIPKRAVEGPGGITATYEFEAFQDSTSGQCLIVDLFNDLDGTQYV